MKYKADIYAPIMPGLSAGGFNLGIGLNDIDSIDLELFRVEIIKDYYLPEYPPIYKYRTTEMTIDFVENKLRLIWLFQGYKGKFESGLGVDEPIGNFEKIFGKPVERYENSFEFSNLKGLSFTFEPANYKLFKKGGSPSELQIEKFCIYPVQ